MGRFGGAATSDLLVALNIALEGASEEGGQGLRSDEDELGLFFRTEVVSFQVAILGCPAVIHAGSLIEHNVLFFLERLQVLLRRLEQSR